MDLPTNPCCGREICYSDVLGLSQDRRNSADILQLTLYKRGDVI